MADESRLIRLLQVAPRFSAFPTTGAELRIFHLAVQLARHMSVTHLGFALPEFAHAPHPGAERVEFVPVSRQGSYRIIDLARGAAGSVPFSVLNYTRDSMKTAVRCRLETGRFDIVMLESIHLAAYLPLVRAARYPPRAVVCDWHNIESEVLARYSDGRVGLMRRLYGRHTAQRLASYERWFVNQCDMHVVVSERDRDTLIRYGCRAPIIVVDNGVDVARFTESEPQAPDRRNRVLYVGSMDALQNADAAVFFASNVWPDIRRALPGSVFTIVGRNPPREVRNLARLEGVEVTGTVDDVRPYYRQAFAAVVPLRVAGGTRLKILEAMAAGVAVVSTRRGAEGLHITPDVHYLLADDATAMRAAVQELARDGAKRERLVAAARTLVQQRYDWPVLADLLAASLLELLGSRDACPIDPSRVGDARERAMNLPRGSHNDRMR
jgi:glycosyltransferase involved in cell wall biosynthesis